MAHDRPLVVVTDETLLDDVLRLGAAVGCELQRAPDLVSAPADWSRAPLVLVDEKSLDDRLPAHPALVLVTRGTPDSEVWRRAFDAGVDHVVPLPEREADLVEALADVAEGPSVPGGCVIGVVGGRGGAGASVFAAALAQTAAADRAGGLLIDCDSLGGGLDMMLGTETTDGARWPALRLDGGRISMPTLREALPEYRRGGRRFPFLSCAEGGAAPTRAAVESVVDAGCRAGAAVICDLPRHLGSAADAVLGRADLIVMVVPAEVRACAAARRVAAHIQGAQRLPLPGDAPHVRPVARPPGADRLPANSFLTSDDDLTQADVEALEALLACGPLLASTTPGSPRRFPQSAASRRRRGTPPDADQGQPDTQHPDTADEPTAKTAVADQSTATHIDDRLATDRPAGAPRAVLTAARRLQRPARSYADRLCLVVRGPAPGGLTPQDIAQVVQVPLLTSMAPDRKLAQALDRGQFFARPRSPLAVAARLTLDAARAEAARSWAAA